MACSSCICPDVDCSPVLSCINNDLLKVQTGTSDSLGNFCSAVSACVDAQFTAIAAGESNDLDNYGFSLIKILQSLSGYTESSDVYLYSTGGILAWTPVSIGHSYVSSSAGITVTGNGGSSTPYIPTLNVSYVKNLFNSTNGLTYTSGVTKFGGTLIEDTIISGASSYDFSIINAQDFVLESLGDTYLQIASYSGASSGDVLTLDNSVTGKVRWSTPSSFSGSFVQNQQAGAQAANFRISGNGWVGLKFTAGALNQITDTSHYFKGVSSDLYPFVVHNSSGVEILALSNYYLKIPDGTANPVPVLPSPYHAGSIYYNTSNNKFLGYTLGNWSELILGTRNLLTTGSLTGGGDLSIDRSLSLVNDNITPGNSKFYGTDGSGVKGWYTSSGGGSVISVGLTAPSMFSVAGSPITSSGTLAISLTVQAVNTVLAGPSIGVSAIPTFRALVTADLSDDLVTFDKIQNITTSRLLGRTTAGSGSIEQLTVGTNLLLSSGVLSVKGKTLVGVTPFTSNGLWVKAAETTSVLVYVVGGGGGGGGVSGNIAEASAAAGGGGGGYSINFISTGFGSSETITVGAGGAGGIAGNNSGSVGGPSSFGALVAANGGNGGSGMVSGTVVETALGGSTGAIPATAGVIIGSGGDPGGYGLRLSGSVAIGGSSGSSFFNGKANNSNTSQIGVAGNAYGVGGSGAVSLNGTSYAGGNGLSGIVIIYEFS